MADFDALVVGGGIAGLSAGLWLARHRRHVRVFDTGEPRNNPTRAVHGYPGITDPAPHELRRVLLEQARDAGAGWEGNDVVEITGRKDDFTVRLKNGDTHRARRIVLAYGVQDRLPAIDGIEELYGRSVFHCPDCDAPSLVGSRIAVVGQRRGAAIHALYLLTWAASVVFLTNGEQTQFGEEARVVLGKYKIPIMTKRIKRLAQASHCLVAIEFEDGDAIPADSLFFQTATHDASDIAAKLGCERDDDDSLTIDNATQTSVPGVFAAGDLAGPPFLAISAAAKGVKTALAVHKSLLPPDQEI